MRKIGFIGAGNMGKAMIEGMLAKGMLEEGQWMVSDKDFTSFQNLGEKYSQACSSDNKRVASFAEILFLAVKPYILSSVLKEISPYIQGKILVSIAAGVSIQEIEEVLGTKQKILRVMPNVASLVGEGMSSLSYNEEVQFEEVKEVERLLSSFGKVEIVEEELIDAVIGVSGSSPAYVFVMLEAMADAAVQTGLSRKQAYRFAAQAVYGAAKMLLDTGKHPGELKDMVCSPSGTTIKAIEVLEKEGFRNAIIQAQLACVEKAKNMKK